MGIINREGALWMATGIDNSGMRRDAKEAEGIIDGIGNYAKKAGYAVGGLFAVAGAKDFISQMIKVRGEFQLMDSSIQTLVGNKEKADALLARVKQYAAVSPLEFKDVSKATQMLLSFNIEAENVPKYLEAIGDISMGETAKFNSLTLAFSQMSSTGKLMGQDLNQMINAGFNPLQVMAEKTGKSIGELKEEMSAGAISSEMVKQAFIDATSEGGKFFKMSENAAKTIPGQIASMNDAWDTMLNDIGTKSEGLIAGAIETSTTLIENYEKVGKVIMGLVATYGVYRVALFLATQAERGYSLASLLTYNRLLLAEKAQKLLNATMLKNPYVLLAVALGTVATALWALNTRTTEAQKAQEQYNKTKELAAKKEEEHKRKIEGLISVVEDEASATLEREAALDVLKKTYPGIFENYITEQGHLRNLIGLKQELAEFDAQSKVERNQIDLKSLDEKIRNREEYIMRMSGSKEAIQEEIDVLNELKRQRAEAQKVVNSDILNKRISEARNLSDGDLNNMIATLKRQFEGVSDDKIGQFDRSEIADYIKALEGVQKARANTVQNKEYWENLKKQAESARNKLSSDEKGSDKWNNLTKQIEAAQKEIDKYSLSATIKSDSEAQKLKEQQEKYKLLIDKQALEQIRSFEDLQTRVEQARIDAMSEGSEKYIEQMELNFEKELQVIDREKEDLLRKKIDDARAVFEADPKNKNKTFDGSKITLSDDELKAYDNLYKEVVAKQATSNEELIKQYQDNAAKRLEIEEKFNKDIEILQAEREKAIIASNAKLVEQIDRAISQANKNKGKELSAFDFTAFKESEDYIRVFEDLGNVSTQTLQALYDKLNALKGEAAKSLDPQDLKAYTDAMKELDNAIRGRNPFAAFISSLKELSAANKELMQAQKDLEKVRSGVQVITKLETDANGKIVATYLTEAQAIEKVNKAKDKQLKSGNDTKKSYEDVSSSISEVTSSLKSLGNAIGGSKGELISDIADVTDGLMELGEGAGQALQGIMSGDPTAIISGVASAIQGVSKLINVFKGKSKTQRDTEQLADVTSKIEVMQDSINKMLERRIELIKQATAAEGTYLKTISLEAVEEQQSYLEAAFERLMGNEIYGKSGRKNNLTLAKLMAKEGLTSLEDFANWWNYEGGNAKLTAEGYDIRNIDYWQSIADSWQELSDAQEEIITAWKETVTGTTLDSLKSELENLVKDADTVFSDISDSFEGHMKDAVMAFVKSSYLTGALESWYEKFADYAASDNKLTQSEVDELQDLYTEMYEQANSMYESALAAAGISNTSSSSQSATTGGYETMSEDTGKELNGRFTAMQMALEEIKGMILTTFPDIAELKRLGMSSNEILSDLRDIALDSVYYLELIYKNTGQLYFMNEKLDKMNKTLENGL